MYVIRCHRCGTAYQYWDGVFHHLCKRCDVPQGYSPCSVAQNKELHDDRRDHAKGEERTSQSQSETEAING